MRKLAPLFASLLVVALATFTSAQENIPSSGLRIDRGIVTFTGSGGLPSGSFTFNGSAFSATGGLQDGLVSPACLPCHAGESVNIRTVFSGELSFRPGTIMQGNTFRDVYYAGELTFDGSHITIPFRYTKLPFTVTFPITLHGSLQFHRLNPFITNSGFLFTIPVDLEGIGRLSLKMIGINPGTGQPLYNFQGLSYDFPQVQSHTSP